MNLPNITKKLLLANFILFLLDVLLQRYGYSLSRVCGLHFVGASGFHIWQPLTYMFMHANWSHILCNMFAVLVFGPTLEESWGGKKFLIYYLVCGIGAAIVQECVWALELRPMLASMDSAAIATATNRLVTIGASGAVFGVLFAFGWLFPDGQIYLYFLIPMRARTFVILYALIELFAGLVPTEGDNVAHFAHLGGMLFGWLLLVWWRHGWRFKFPKLGRRNDKDYESNNKDYSNFHYQKRV
ncbi:MAG: rhomboid family intramembrane serine protease [Bacteroidales bacterium]|nr:rhomboid family intramembrane serine protease [Candidatus Colicola coprequi]